VSGPPPELILPPFLVVAGLLAVSGLAKLRAPGGAARALASARLPSSRAVVRALGAVELAVGLAALVQPRPLAPAVALLYLGFAGFVVHALAAGVPMATCGCLGDEETPPTALHAAVTATAAACAALVAATPVPDTPGLLAGSPWLGAPLVALVAVGVLLAYAVMAHLPAALGSYRPERAPERA